MSETGLEQESRSLTQETHSLTGLEHESHFLRFYIMIFPRYEIGDIEYTEHGINLTPQDSDGLDICGFKIYAESRKHIQDLIQQIFEFARNKKLATSEIGC